MDELPKDGVGPDKVTEVLLVGHGYRRRPPAGTDTQFVEIDVSGTFHPILHVVRVWEDTTIGPGQSITIGTDDVSVFFGWDQSAPSKDGTVFERRLLSISI